MLKLLVGFVLIFSPLCSGQGSCEYSFVQQPPAQLKCNPWPYIEQTGNLSIHCDIVGAQNSNAPHVRWFVRRSGRFIPRRLNIHHRKYFGPTSSGHNTQSGLKRVNFTLKITNVASVDVGCYWCRIYVTSSTCSFVSPRSSSFCLQLEESYSHLNNCTELPVNSTPLCSANNTCATQTMNNATNSDDNMNQIRRSSIAIPQLTTSHKTAPVYSTAFSHPTITSTPVFSPAPQHTLSPDQSSGTTTGIVHHSLSPHQSSGAATGIVHHSLSPHQSSGTATGIVHLSPDQSSGAATGILHHSLSPDQSSGTATGIVHHSLSPDQSSGAATGIVHPEITFTMSEAVTSSGEPPGGTSLGGEDMVEPWVYVGIALCFVLLLVIVVLVVGVVLLCRRKAKRPKGRSEAPRSAVAYSIHSGTSSWTHRPTSDDSNLGAPSVSCNTSLRTPPSAPTPTNEVLKRDSMSSHTTEQTNGETEMEFPYYHVLEQSNEETEMDVNHYHVLEQSNEETEMDVNHYHVLEQSNGETEMDLHHYHVLEQSNGETDMDLHHYHTLERPVYYNCPLISEEEADQSGHSNRLLNTVRLSWLRFSRDSKIFPSPKGASCQDYEKTYASPWTKPASEESLPHVYKDLDQSTMEPIREYTRLIAPK